ncbi:MAG: hypothetical protein QXY36_03575 [Sulfolobales archaeon]
MPSSTTIYTSRSLDAIFGTAALAATLFKKGFKVFVEFPKPSEMSKISITNSYAVDITHLSNVQIRNSVAMTHVPMKRLGLVYRYDGNGRYSTTMKLSNINSTLEVVVEYVKTLNDNVFVPQELLKDLARIKAKDLSKLTRVGRSIYYAYKWGLDRDETLLSLYNYAYTLFTSKNMKITPEIERDAKNYEYALSLINTIIKERSYEVFGDIATIVISSKYNNHELIKNNINYLRVVSSELLGNLCREHKISVLVNEGTSGYDIRLCVNKDLNIDADRIIRSLPNNILDMVDFKTAKTHAYIVFKNSELATLENALKLTQTLVSTSATFINHSQQTT